MSAATLKPIRLEYYLPRLSGVIELYLYTSIPIGIEVYLCSPSGSSWPVLGLTLPLHVLHFYSVQYNTTG